MLKNKPMYLLEVFDVTSNRYLFKRRISDNIDSIEDWVMANAQKWVLLPIEVECDGYGCGKVCLYNNHGTIYEFKTTAIGVI